MFIQAHLAIACKPSLKVSGIWSCCFLYGSHTGTWLLLRCCVSSVLQTVWTQLGVFHIVACHLLGFLYGFLEEIIIGNSDSLHLYVCYQTWFAILW